MPVLALQQYADYNFCTSGGVNQPTAVATSIARLVDATGKAGRECGALILQMTIADETDAVAMAKWEHYRLVQMSKRWHGTMHKLKTIRARSSQTAAKL